MSRLVNLSDPVYEELTRLKKARGASYSEVIAGLLQKQEGGQKTHGWKEMNEWARQRADAYNGKKEKTDHDLIAYGVSRDSP